jgi:hypothetical protein
MKLDKFEYTKVELQDNIYFVKIKSIKLKVWTEENKSLNWAFEIVQPPFIGKSVLIWGSTSTTPTPKARLTQFGAALGYTREALADESFDTDNIVGSYVKAFLETTPKEDGSTKQHVTKLLALTEVDTQILQGYLAQAQVTGPAKVAVQATPTSTVPLTPTVTHNMPSMQPVSPVVSQPTVPSSIGSPALATTPKGPRPIIPF